MRSSSSLLSGHRSPAGPQRNDSPQACVFIDEHSSQALCLGKVGESLEGFLKDKFCHHRAISGCFVQFLMRHMADQSALGLKTTVEKLKALVKELKAAMANKVSAEMFNKLNSKVANMVRKPA